MEVMMKAVPVRRWWALAALALAVLATALDMTVLNVALPTLARDLHASTSDQQWFASAYLLTLAAVMLPIGRWATGTAGASCCWPPCWCSGPARPGAHSPPVPPS
jgi:MFS family permease